MEERLNTLIGMLYFSVIMILTYSLFGNIQGSFLYTAQLRTIKVMEAVTFIMITLWLDTWRSNQPPQEFTFTKMKKTILISIVTAVLCFILAALNCSSAITRLNVASQLIDTLHYIGEIIVWICLGLFFSFYANKSVKIYRHVHKKSSSEEEHHHHHHHHHHRGSNRSHLFLNEEDSQLAKKIGESTR